MSPLEEKLLADQKLQLIGQLNPDDMPMPSIFWTSTTHLGMVVVSYVSKYLMVPVWTWPTHLGL